ncbi:MAG: restriction endonuclease [Burkholderiales bacterium]|nr:restriction endonuclease [Burkholderiales bacterium]
MALWLVRAGKYGEHETRFLDDNRIYLTWDAFTETDLSVAKDYEGVKALMSQRYPSEPSRRLGNWSGQVWAFLLAMKVGDWVVVPSKTSPTIAIGEVVGPYAFDPKAEPMYRHSRAIKWLNKAVLRSAFGQDLLYSMGAFLTVCEIKRNDAEARVRRMAANGWRDVLVNTTASVPSNGGAESQADAVDVDLEELARDAIGKLIIQRFKGHGMARLVEAILKAQGFATYLSPEGPDKGIDILAAGGAFGFERPRICVQVKSGDTPADRPEFTQLIGAMQSVKAEQGLFVSWAGFKPTVLKEVPTHFFSVRVWNEKDLVEQVLANYDKLDQDVRAELPLKRVWMIASSEE